jgi:hypothetical protein
MKELEAHLSTLRTLRSTHNGGPAGIICPVPGVASHFPGDEVSPSISSSDDDYVFCHCDLQQSNIIVDKDTLKISGITSWEHVGYYPNYFESPYYRSSWPSGWQVKHLPNNSKMISFFGKGCDC